MVLKVRKLHALTMSSFSCPCELKFTSFVHAMALKQSTEKKEKQSLFSSGSWPVPRSGWRKCCCCGGRIREKDQVCTGHGNWCGISCAKQLSDLQHLTVTFLLISRNGHNCISLPWMKWLCSIRIYFICGTHKWFAGSACLLVSWDWRKMLLWVWLFEQVRLPENCLHPEISTGLSAATDRIVVMMHDHLNSRSWALRTADIQVTKHY